MKLFGIIELQGLKSSCIDMLFLCSSKCSLLKKLCFTNILYNPSQYGLISNKPSIGGFLDVYVGSDLD